MQIVKIDTAVIGSNTVKTVNARELHQWLEVGKDFSEWVKGRIEQYSFVENQDFMVVKSAPQNGGAGNRGAKIDYHISLDMAKELSMVERNEKGKQARQYFIECERKANAVMTPAQMLLAQAQQMVDMEARLGATEEKLKQIEVNLPREQDYFTIIGWSRYIGSTVSNSEALTLGRKCAALSRKRGVPIGDTTDPRFGTVHTYHAGVCDEVFTAHYGA
jgi:phage anti-repressor protein